MKKLTTKEFKDRILLIHKNKFIYDKTDLENRDEKGRVIITCPIHGDFLQTPKNHLHGQGCPKCSHKSTKYTVEEIKEKIRKKYNGKYDVSLITEYSNNTQKLPLICDKHGYFEATWNDLDNNHGCQKCGKIKNYESLRKTSKTFIEEAIKIHGSNYDYSFVDYKRAHSYISLKCNKCGHLFKIMPNEHLKGKGCPRCNESHLENEIRLFLETNNIDFYDKKHFNWLGLQHLDFYLPKYNMGIECQGKQHFEAVKHFGGLQGYKTRFLLDKNKKELCKEHNVRILYYTHEDYDSFLGEQLIKNTDKLLEEIKKEENE
jgi:hypothetical protein